MNDAFGGDPESPTMSTTQATLLASLRDAGDHASWQRFFDIYWKLLYSIARRSGLADAESKDVVQEAMIDVSKQMPNFQYDRKRGSFKSWLAVIMRRRIVDHRRGKNYKNMGVEMPREERLGTALEAEQAAPDREFEKAWTEEWESHLLSAAMARVKQQTDGKQLQMFHLHVLKGQTVEEVCARLGCTGMAVYWAKYKLTRLLKKAMKEIEEG